MCLAHIDSEKSEAHQKLEEVPAMAETTALDSDFLKLYMAPTSLPTIPNDTGVFARHKILKGELVCEFRGNLNKSILFNMLVLQIIDSPNLRCLL